MRQYGILAPFVLLIFFTACKDKPDHPDVEELMFRTDTTKYMDLRPFVSEVSMIALQNDSSPLRTPGRMATNEDGYFILGISAPFPILHFDKQGNLLHYIERYGRGPGEYSWLEAITVDPKANVIDALDIQQNKIISYTYSGEFIDEWETPGIMNYDDFMKLDSTHYIIYQNLTNGYKGKPFHQIKWVHKQEQLQICNEFLYTPNPNNYLNIGGSFHFYDYRGKPRIKPIGSNYVYEFSDSLLRPVYHINFADNELPEGYYQEKDYNGVIEFSNAIDKTNYINSVRQFAETEKYIFFNYSQSGNALHAVYNKKTKNTHTGGISVLPVNNGKKLIRIPYFPKYIAEGHLYFMAHPSRLEKYAAGKQHFQELLALLPSLKLAYQKDYYVLMKCKLK